MPDAPRKFSHQATGKFWIHYRQLPPEIQTLDDKTYLLLKENPRHPSLQFKKIGKAGQCASVCIIGLWRPKFLKDFFGSGSAFTTNTI